MKKVKIRNKKEIEKEREKESENEDEDEESNIMWSIDENEQFYYLYKNNYLFSKLGCLLPRLWSQWLIFKVSRQPRFSTQEHTINFKINIIIKKYYFKIIIMH